MQLRLDMGQSKGTFSPIWCHALEKLPFKRLLRTHNFKTAEVIRTKGTQYYVQARFETCSQNSVRSKNPSETGPIADLRFRPTPFLG